MVANKNIIGRKEEIRMLERLLKSPGVEAPLPPRGASVLLAGDMSTLSFHATKVFNTLEGGALIVHDAEIKRQIDYLKNFGFAGETRELWQMEGRVERDIWYIQHWSLWLDLRIIWLTFKTIFKRDKKAY